jgi:hypothetical protein
MNHKLARSISVILIGIYIFLVFFGLYSQGQTGRIMLEGGEITFSILVGAGLMFLVWIAVGTIILWHYPRNWIGWIMLLFPLSWGLDLFTWGYYVISLDSNSGLSLPVQAAIVWQNLNDFPSSVFVTSFLFLLFPTGHPHSPGWRRVAKVGALMYGGYILTESLKPGPIFPGLFGSGQSNPLNPLNPIAISDPASSLIMPLNAFFLFASSIFLVLAVVSLFVRLKNSRGDEHQQIKWLAYFAAIDSVLIVAVLMIQSAAENLPITGNYVLPVGIVTVVVTMGMAVAIGVAIYKYRLYAIDIIIRRTLVYGLLTGALVLIYLISVAFLQSLMTAVSGQRSTVAIVISTLTIAALFSPLRRRIQTSIDRRFYRRRYDTEKILASFSQAVREEVDLESLSLTLLKVVGETVQPEGISLWLQQHSEHGPGALGQRKPSPP